MTLCRSRKGCALDEVTHFERVAGGAPANVAAAVARLGGTAGHDIPGRRGCVRYAYPQGPAVPTAWIPETCFAPERRTPVWPLYPWTLPETVGSFLTFRNPSADLFLCEEQITPAMFADCAALHFCSVDLVDWPVKAAHRRAIGLAQEAGALISFDPNVRLPLWERPEDCQAAIRAFLPFADLVKLSDDEVEFVTGCKEEREAARRLFAGGCRMLLVTRGADGAAI